MSTLGSVLTTWDEFRELPDGRDGTHYELHDGEVVEVPPAKANHVYIQGLLVEWLIAAAEGRGRAAAEFPYRPAANLQFWYADVAYVPHEGWRLMRGDDYPVYAPPLIVEVLSPSNRASDIQRQRVAAFSAGTREFWVVDPKSQTVEVSVPGRPSRIYSADETVPVAVLPGAALRIAALFEA
jgi:Uma2 family endonuclease